MFMKKKETVYGKIKKSLRQESDGFTFIETLAVLAIGTILSAGCFFSATKLISIAKRSSAESQINQFSSALQIYFLECGRFPTTEQGLSALWEKPVLHPVPENWNGPYLDHKPQSDPWGTNYKYISSESSPLPTEAPKNLPFVLISYGADKISGGEGENHDICSWE